ncbi:MAG: hypothetical protein ABH851_08580, partial [Methanobacteriota archaeon]
MDGRAYKELSSMIEDSSIVNGFPFGHYPTGLGLIKTFFQAIERRYAASIASLINLYERLRCARRDLNPGHRLG